MDKEFFVKVVNTTLSSYTTWMIFMY